MSILDEMMRAALSQLQLTGDEIDAWWVKALAEIGDDDLRYIRERQLNTELRSSTPEDHQLMRAEHQLSELEEKALPLLKKALPTMFAIERQQARIAKIKKTLERQKRERAEKPKDAVRPEFLRFVKMLERLGTDHGKVLQLRYHELVIFADLIRWKAKDPLVVDRANPWRELYSTYQNRTIEFEEPRRRSKTMSEPGAPPPRPAKPEVFWGYRYWQFGKIVAKFTKGDETIVPLARDEPAQPSLAVSEQPGPQPVAPAVPPQPDAPALTELQRLRIKRSSQYWGASEPILEEVGIFDAPDEGELEIDSDELSADIFDPGHLTREKLADLTPGEAMLLATAVYDQLPNKLDVYWPYPARSNNYDLEYVIPLLEADIAEKGKSVWIERPRFLEAMKAGRGREFIEEKRNAEIISLAKGIARADADAVADLKAAGLLE